MRRRLLSTSTRRRTLSAIVRVSWGTCGVLAVGESMLLVVLAFLDIAVAQSLEQAEELQPELPVPGDYVAWAHEGSPMDCLLTANEAGLAVYFGHMACFSQSDR